MGYRRRPFLIQIVRTAGCAWLALAFPLAFPLAAPAQDAELAPAKTSSLPAEETGRYAEMDHGPFFSGTIDTLFPERESYANKGIVVRLRRDPPAALCFDTELLKVSAGWTGGFLGWPHGRDGMEGEPFPVGDLKFGTKPESLGWAKGDDFGDPRRIPYGPLPRDWAKYRGLYRHGDRVVLRASAVRVWSFSAPSARRDSLLVSELFEPVRHVGNRVARCFEMDGLESEKPSAFRVDVVPGILQGDRQRCRIEEDLRRADDHAEWSFLARLDGCTDHPVFLDKVELTTLASPPG